jgi:hypothetical protein
MDKVAIVTDSAAGIPPEIARDLGIEIIPMQIVKDDVAYTIDRDITAGEVYLTAARAPHNGKLREMLEKGREGPFHTCGLQAYEHRCYMPDGSRYARTGPDKRDRQLEPYDNVWPALHICGEECAIRR